MCSKVIRIGTRGSQLALYQANKVKSELEAIYKDHSFELEIIKTKGDKILDVALSKIGDKGLFTKELEVVLLDGGIDLAVHSLKDMPTVFPEGTMLGAVLERADRRDALVSDKPVSINDLSETDVIATSSLRRKAQLLYANPKLNIVDIRGNVNTRLKKMEDGYCNVMVMAAAGLQRLGFDNRIAELIEPEVMIPACGQGAIAVQIREGDNELFDMLRPINHENTLITTSAERAFLNELEGGCQIPLGSYSSIDGNVFHITGFVADIEGTVMLQRDAEGPVDQAEKIARKLAHDILAAGGDVILKQIRESLNN